MNIALFAAIERFPTVRVEGGPRERGQQYGAQAREQVRQSVVTYRDAFAHFAGWTWNQVREKAAAFETPISEYEPRYLEEIEGIAEGADIEPVDVLPINVCTGVSGHRPCCAEDVARCRLAVQRGLRRT